MTLAAIFAAVAMTFSACEKEGDKNGQGNNNNGNNEPEYESPITVDGNFDDWAALGNKAEIAVCPEDALKLGLKEMRAYADEMYLHVMVEFDFDVVTDRGSVESGSSGNTFTLYFSSSADKGGYDVWSDLCVEGHCACYIFTGTDGVYNNWDDALYMWTGETHASGWYWDTVAVESLAATGAGSDNKYEIAILMEVLGGVFELDGKILLGAMVQQGWNDAGHLPCVSPDPDNNPTGSAPMMEVPIN